MFEIFDLIRLSRSIDKRIDLIVLFSRYISLEIAIVFVIALLVFKMNFVSWNHKLPINDDHWSMMMILRAFKPSAVSILYGNLERTTKRRLENHFLHSIRIVSRISRTLCETAGIADEPRSYIAFNFLFAHFSMKKKTQSNNKQIVAKLKQTPQNTNKVRIDISEWLPSCALLTIYNQWFQLTSYNYLK